MKKNFYYLSLMLGMVFGMMMFTACGGGDDDDDSDDRSGSTKDSGGTVGTGDVLKPGVYFCLGMSQFHDDFTGSSARGDMNRITVLVNQHGSDPMYDRAAVRVEKGDKLGTIPVYTSFTRPSTTECILVSTQIYTDNNSSKTVYFFVKKEGDYLDYINEEGKIDYYIFTWAEWSKNGWLYENGNLVHIGEHWSSTLGQVDRVVYKYVK